MQAGRTARSLDSMGAKQPIVYIFKPFTKIIPQQTHKEKWAKTQSYLQIQYNIKYLQFFSFRKPKITVTIIEFIFIQSYMYVHEYVYNCFEVLIGISDCNANLAHKFAFALFSG